MGISSFFFPFYYLIYLWKLLGFWGLPSPICFGMDSLFITWNRAADRKKARLEVLLRLASFLSVTLQKGRMVIKSMFKDNIPPSKVEEISWPWGD